MSKGKANTFLWVCGGLLVLGYIGSKSGTHSDVSMQSASVQSAAYSKPSQPLLESLMPESQRAFMEVVRRGQVAYKNGANDMAKGATRPARARELCSVMQGGRADNWVGSVYSLSSNNDGKGVLTIYLGNDTYVKTWNNSVSDYADRTLIEPESKLFGDASSLSAKQPVVFSGSFSRDKQDCWHESSMTISGSMEEPEFIMKFSRISKIN